MRGLDSAIDRDALARARALLRPKARPEPVWPALAAAGLLAASAVGFAVAMVIAPPLVTHDLARGAPAD